LCDAMQRSATAAQRCRCDAREHIRADPHLGPKPSAPERPGRSLNRLLVDAGASAEPVRHGQISTDAGLFLSSVLAWSWLQPFCALQRGVGGQSPEANHFGSGTHLYSKLQHKSLLSSASWSGAAVKATIEHQRRSTPGDKEFRGKVSLRHLAIGF